MAETKPLQDDLKTLNKFSQQLHMYGPDQLRTALKLTIGMAKKAMELCSTAELSVQQAERRKAKRFPMNIKAAYFPLMDGERGEILENGIILNLSKTGLLLASPVPLEAGEVLVIMFDINWDEITGVPVGVLGTIVRERTDFAATRLGKYHYSYGVKFKLSRKVA